MKITYLKNVVISLGLLSAQALFAQNDNKNQEQITPVLQTSYEYSNISDYTENNNFAPLSQTGFQVDLTPEMQMDPTIEEGAEVLEAALGLEAFRKALEAHPAAERLVIHREGNSFSIRPLEASSNITEAVVRRENSTIVDRLRSLLPPELADDPLLRNQVSSIDNNIMRFGINPLSSARLREILSRLDATRSTATISILQNRGNTSNTFSSSSQPIDSVLKEQTQQAIKRVISNSSTQLQDHYKKADEAWAERDCGWKEQSQLHHELQESRKQLTLSEQKLQQATKATTSEELNKTRLGKISKYAGMAGGILGNAPEPNAQVAGIGTSVLGGIAGAINTAWAHGNLALTRREHQQISKQHELAQERKDQAQQQLLPLEQRAQQMEALAFTQAEQAARTLAQQLHPQADWQESQYQIWGTLVSPTWNENEKHHLINQARLNPNWVEEVTKKSWEQKIETGKEQYTALQKKANISSLERQYQNARQQHERAQTQEGQQRNFLNQGQNSIEDLKGEIEKRVDELEKLETRDKIQFEQKKKEFIKKLEELEKTQLRLQGLQKKWEEAVERTSNQDEQRWTASKNYQNAKEEAERMLARIKKSYQTDRELLQKIWLKSASSNYKEWSLPEISSSHESHETENASNLFEETIKSEESAPPVQRLEEVEARGRNLRLREAMMSSATTVEKPTVLTSIFRSFSKQPSSSYLPQSNLDQVREWTLQKQEHPSVQDQKRWEVLEQLDQVQKEISVKRKAFQQGESFMEEPMGNGNEMDDGDDDGKSKLSTATTRTASSKTSSFSSSSSASSSLSAGKSSIFSFSGKTLFNSSSKKKSASSLSPISENSEESQDPQEKLRRLQEQASRLKKSYFELLDQAENERLSSLKGQRAAIPFSKETDRNYAWEEVDRKNVTLIQEKRQEEEDKKLEQEQQGSWQINTERWRVRAQADHADKAFKQAQQRTLKLGEEATRAKTIAQITEADRKKDEASVEEKRLKQVWLAAEKEWGKLAQEYRDERSEQSLAQEKSNEATQEQASEKFKERDRAVNKRWEKLLKNDQNPELEKSAVEQEEVSEAIMALENQLEKAYQESFITYKNREAALAHYKEVAFQRAVENARNHPEEMAETWEKIAARQNASTQEQNIGAQLEKLEINKQAAAVFKEEVKRLEKIERIWRRILKEEQETAKQKREQAAQAYYQGQHTDWNALSDQERMRYNSEAIKANEAYDQKGDEARKLITEAEAEKFEIEAEIKRIEGKTLITPAKRKEKLARYYQQLEEQGDIIKKNSEQLKEQEEFLRIGKKAKEKENYYEALAQAQNSKEKVKEGKNLYWKKAAECYEQASTHWKEAADDKTLESQQKQSEKTAASYQSAAAFYEKAAQENAVLLTSHNKGKEVLIQLYDEAARLHEQLAEQQEKGELTSESSDTYNLQETLYQLEKKIDRYLGTRGAQIEELQESIPLIKKRLEELTKEIVTLNQQGKEVLASKKEALTTNFNELASPSHKALEDLLQETPESSERAAAVLDTIRLHMTKDQQLQKIVEQARQLEEKVAPLEQRTKLLQSTAEASKIEGKIFLAQAQDSLCKQFHHSIAEIKQLQSRLLTAEEESSILSVSFEICLKNLKQLEQRNQELQKNSSQLSELDQSKAICQKRLIALQSEVVTSKNKGEHFLVQGQEKLLNQATNLLSEIDLTAEQLIANQEQASKQASALLLRLTQFQEQDKVFQNNATSLQNLSQKKTAFQNRNESLSKEIEVSQNRGEKFLLQPQQRFLEDIAQALSTIDRSAEQLLTGATDSSEQVFNQLNQLEQRDQNFQKNIPTLLNLDQIKNFFQPRLQDLHNELAASLNQGWTYLGQVQQSFTSELTQALSTLDRTAKQLSAGEAQTSEMGLLFTQSEQLKKQDQLLQQNSPILRKLDEKKNFFSTRVTTLQAELKISQERQQLLFVEGQQALSGELNQALANIDKAAKQLLAGSSEGAKALCIQLDQLEKQDLCFQQHFTQLKELEEKRAALQIRTEALKGELASSQLRGEAFLAQVQQTLLEELRKTLQDFSQTARKLLIEANGMDEKTSDEASLRMKELIPLLDQLQLRDQRLQGNALLLKDLEQKKNFFEKRVETLSSEIIASHGEEEKPFIQRRQVLLEAFQPAVKHASELMKQLMVGTDDAFAQTKALFLQFDQLQLQDQQLQEDQQISSQLRALDQNKTILQQRVIALKEEITTSQDQKETFLTQGQQQFLSEATQRLSMFDQSAELLSARAERASEKTKDLLLWCTQFKERDEGLQQNAPFLRELEQKKNALQIRLEGLADEIKTFLDRKEKLLLEAKQSLLKEIREKLENVNKHANHLVTGTKEAQEQAQAMLTDLEKLLQRDHYFQVNASSISQLEQQALQLQKNIVFWNSEIGNSRNQDQELLANIQQELLNKLSNQNKSYEKIVQAFYGANLPPQATIEALLEQAVALKKEEESFHVLKTQVIKLDCIKKDLQRVAASVSKEADFSKERQENAIAHRQEKLSSDAIQMIQSCEEIAKTVLKKDPNVENQVQAMIKQALEVEQEQGHLQKLFEWKHNAEKEKNIWRSREAILQREIGAWDQEKGTILLQREKTLLSSIQELNKKVQETVEVMNRGESIDALLEVTAQQSAIAQKVYDQLQKNRSVVSFLEREAIKNDQLQREMEQKAQTANQKEEKSASIHLQEIAQHYTTIAANYRTASEQLALGNTQEEVKKRKQIDQITEGIHLLQKEVLSYDADEHTALKAAMEWEKQQEIQKANCERTKAVCYQKIAALYQRISQVIAEGKEKQEDDNEVTLLKKEIETQSHKQKENDLQRAELLEKKNVLGQVIAKVQQSITEAQKQQGTILAEKLQQMSDNLKNATLQLETTIQALRADDPKALQSREQVLKEIAQLHTEKNKTDRTTSDLISWEQSAHHAKEEARKSAQLITTMLPGHKREEQLQLTTLWDRINTHYLEATYQLAYGIEEESREYKKQADTLLKDDLIIWQQNTQRLCELEQEKAALQVRAEAIQREIISSKNQGEILVQCQQKLLEAVQETRDHASEQIAQLTLGVNYTPELAEAQRRVQIEKLAKIAAAEKTLVERKELEQKRAAEEAVIEAARLEAIRVEAAKRAESIYKIGWQWGKLTSQERMSTIEIKIREATSAVHRGKEEVEKATKRKEKLEREGADYSTIRYPDSQRFNYVTEALSTAEKAGEYLTMLKQSTSDETSYIWYTAVLEAEKAISLFQASEEKYVNSANAYEGSSMGDAALRISKSASVMAEIAHWTISCNKAMSIVETRVEVNFWQQAISSAEQAILNYRECAEKHVAGNDFCGSKNAAGYYMFTGYHLMAVAQGMAWNAKEVEAIREGKTGEANLWKDAAKNIEKADKRYQLAISKCIIGDSSSPCDRLNDLMVPSSINNGFWSEYWEANGIETRTREKMKNLSSATLELAQEEIMAASCLEKAAASRDNQEVALLYTQIAEVIKTAVANTCEKTGRVVTEVEFKRWSNACNACKNAFNELSSMYSLNHRDADVARRAPNIFKEMAKFQLRAAKAYATGNQGEIRRWESLDCYDKEKTASQYYWFHHGISFSFGSDASKSLDSSAKILKELSDVMGPSSS